MKEFRDVFVIWAATMVAGLIAWTLMSVCDRGLQVTINDRVYLIKLESK